MSSQMDERAAHVNGAPMALFCGGAELGKVRFTPVGVQAARTTMRA
jgi:hypothetical protein